MKRIVIVGLGNILLSDEGVGVRIIEELRKLNLPENVKIYEGGVLGLFILNFFKDADKAIVVDAVRAGGKPGDIYCFSIEEVLNSDDHSKRIISLHDLDFVYALKMCKGILDLPEDIIVVGIEPEKIEEGLELSASVKKAIPKAIDLILKLIHD